MGAYRADYDDLATLGSDVEVHSGHMAEQSTVLDRSARNIAASHTLEELGYASLTQRSSQSASRLAEEVRKVSQALTEVSRLCTDYERRAIAALEQQAEGGNGFSPKSRSEVRDTSEQVEKERQAYEDKVVETAPSTETQLPASKELTQEEKRERVIQWLRDEHGPLLDQIYEKLYGGAGAVAAGAVTAGLAGAVVTGTSSAPMVTDDTRAGVDASLADKVASSVDAGTTDRGAMGAGADASGSGSGAGAADGSSGLGVGAGESAGLGDDSWLSDMLNEAADQDLMKAAQDEVTQVAGGTSGKATGAGLSALEGKADLLLDSEKVNILAKYGKRLGEVVSKYGARTGFIVSGIGGAYLVSPITIEAVAHCAEFMSLKCIPHAHDVIGRMGRGHKCRAMRLGKVVGAATAAKAGGLLG